MSQSVNLSRRNLLRGRSATAVAPLRPPGALREALFANQCTACGECVTACPQHIIHSGSGGYPEVDFRRGECTFCARCIDVCADDALQHDIRPPWRLTIRLEDNCLARKQVICQTCGDACETEAIRFRPRTGVVAIPEIDSDRCTGCGACIAACPEDALTAIPNG